LADHLRRRSRLCGTGATPARDSTFWLRDDG
jgi:hypothetical protein